MSISLSYYIEERERGRRGQRERKNGEREKGTGRKKEWKGGRRGQKERKNGREGEMGGVSEGEVVVVSCPARTRPLMRNGLVNKVEFLGLYSPKVVRTNEIVRSVIIM